MIDVRYFLQGKLSQSASSRTGCNLLCPATLNDNNFVPLVTSMNKSEEYQIPTGFQFAGIACGIKSDNQTKDLMLLTSQRDCTAAGVFTTNKTCGAPVQVSRERVPSQSVRALVINSGNANACTAEQGLNDAREMTSLVAKELGVEPEAVLVCSTGLIGHPLPMQKIRDGISQAAASLGDQPEHLENAAAAMMTTDTYPKIVSRTVHLQAGTVLVTGIAKGAAMIAPNMATMLACITTDLQMTPETCDETLRIAVNQSFNRISVEGHTSTSDTVFLLANGASEIPLQSRADVTIFQAALDEVCLELAHLIIRDAEGAGHFVAVDVEGARSFEEAEKIAKTVAEDVLVKTAITGNDPNWGRIVSACGRTGCIESEKDISLAINNYGIFKKGTLVEYDEQKVSAAMKTGEVVIDITLPYGKGRWRIWTCDLTQEYIRLNSEYTT